MLLVRTFLAESQIDGFGLFADEYIPAGTLVWRFDRRVDLALEHDYIDKLLPAFRIYCEKYAYLDIRLKKYIICGDDARFVNHSETPNLIGQYPFDQEYGIDIASCDIIAGEELTSNYSTYDSEFCTKLKLPGLHV